MSNFQLETDLGIKFLEKQVQAIEAMGDASKGVVGLEENVRRLQMGAVVSTDSAFRTWMKDANASFAQFSETVVVSFKRWADMLEKADTQGKNTEDIATVKKLVAKIAGDAEGLKAVQVPVLTDVNTANPDVNAEVLSELILGYGKFLPLYHDGFSDLAAVAKEIEDSPVSSALAKDQIVAPIEGMLKTYNAQYEDASSTILSLIKDHHENLAEDARGVVKGIQELSSVSSLTSADELSGVKEMRRGV